jgi:lipopolysaccharide transport system ATP-binding protein
MDTAIRVCGLSKRYRVGQSAGYKTLRESIVAKFRMPRLSNEFEQKTGGNQCETFWALDNISFDVKQGEVLGIIGSNGAGKSTALKILSRITRPTAGRVELHGHVRSLLEVGTGFHPELTGRENIFLNGAILGMRRNEIARKFEEIVSFAEIEKFIDTPVKHYSSGMYVRLAFAVAANLEPEILLVDEVLAVGDSRFYQKSTDKMRELNAKGMTIVLVSHHMWLIQTVCTRGMLLKHGQIVADGQPQNVIDAYRRATGANGREPKPVGTGLAAPEIRGVEMTFTGDRASLHQATPDSGIRLNLVVYVPDRSHVKFFIRLTSADGFSFFTVYSEPTEVPENLVLNCQAVIPRLMLHDGDYFVWSGVCSDREKEEVLVETHLPMEVRDSALSHPQRGVFWNSANWQIT